MIPQVVCRYFRCIYYTRNRKLGNIHTGGHCVPFQAATFSLSSRCTQKPVELAYASYNDNSNDLPPLLILHGLLGSKLNWKSLCKAINKQSKRQVIALDARNHGDSLHSDSMDYESMSADVEHFMLQHSISQVVLLGHSMGGKTAMLTALTKPELIESLVIVDSSPVPVILEDSSTAYFGKLLATMKSALKEVTGKGLTLTEARRQCDKYIAKDFPDTALRQFVLTNLVQSNTGELSWKANVNALEKDFSSIITYTMPEKQFHKPTIFICGANSNYVRDGDKESIYSLFPKAQVIHVKDAGHWVHADKPNEFVAILLQFLNDNQK